MSQLRSALLQVDPDEDSTLTSRKVLSGVVDGRYAPALGRAQGAPTTGTHLAGVPFSANVDLKTGQTLKLSADGPLGVLQSEPAWAVTERGIAFLYYAQYEGGYDDTVELPWSELRS